MHAMTVHDYHTPKLRLLHHHHLLHNLFCCDSNVTWTPKHRSSRTAKGWAPRPPSTSSRTSVPTHAARHGSLVATPEPRPEHSPSVLWTAEARQLRNSQRCSSTNTEPHSLQVTLLSPALWPRRPGVLCGPELPHRSGSLLLVAAPESSDECNPRIEAVGGTLCITTSTILKYSSSKIFRAARNLNLIRAAIALISVPAVPAEAFVINFLNLLGIARLTSPLHFCWTIGKQNLRQRLGDSRHCKGPTYKRKLRSSCKFCCRASVVAETLFSLGPCRGAASSLLHEAMPRALKKCHLSSLLAASPTRCGTRSQGGRSKSSTAAPAAQPESMVRGASISSHTHDVHRKCHQWRAAATARPCTGNLIHAVRPASHCDNQRI